MLTGSRSKTAAVWVLAIALATLAIPVTAATRPVKLRQTPNVLFDDSYSAEFLFPAVGSAAGANGTYWHSAAVISNFNDNQQRVAFTFIPQGGTASAPVYRTLPGFVTGGDIGFVTDDVVQSLGFTGMGALLVQAVDANGAVDPNARIDGFTRVWTAQPAAGGCSQPTGTMSQSVLAVPPNGLTGATWSAFAAGARQDAGFRTNVGIVNLSEQSQTFRVNLIGSAGAQAEFRVTVPGRSMIQQPPPEGTYGTMSIAFSLEGSNVNSVNWAAYTSTVDNATGDAWTRNAVY